MARSRTGARSHPGEKPVRVELARSRTAPRAARGAVRDALGGWRLDVLADVAALLTSELVTNAVRHAGSDVTITIACLPTGIRIEVSDARRDAMPRLAHATPEDEGGRGLWLVDQMASAWGTSTDGAGKSVWFELVVDAATPPPRAR